MLLNIIHQNLIKNPNKTALVYNNKKISYKLLFLKSLQICQIIKKNKNQKNLKILVLMENSSEMICLFLANLILRNTIIPIDPSIKKAELDENFKKMKVDLIILDKENNIIKKKFKKTKTIVLKKIIFSKKFDKSKKQILKKSLTNKSNFEYIVSSSSGTTGSSKKIVLTNLLKYERAINAIKTYNLKKNYKNLICTPLFHTLAQRIMFITLITGSTIYLQKFTPSNWIEIVKSKKIDFTMMVSIQIKRIFLLKKIKKEHFKHIKCLVSSSESLEYELKKKIVKKFNVNLNEIYGLSEAGTLTNLNVKKNFNKIKSVGQPVDQTKIRIINKKKGLGEITYKSSRIYKRLFNKKKVMNKKYYYKTGDIGYLDNDNFLYFTGRKKEIIRFAGTNVHPKIIEKIILKFKDVEDCAVIGVKNKKFGEIIVALVKKKKHSKISLKNIQSYCYQNLSYSHQPMVFKFIDRLPKNSMGKIIKRKLVKKYYYIKPPYKLLAGI